MKIGMNCVRPDFISPELLKKLAPGDEVSIPVEISTGGPLFQRATFVAQNGNCVTVQVDQSLVNPETGVPFFEAGQEITVSWLQVREAPAATRP